MPDELSDKVEFRGIAKIDSVGPLGYHANPVFLQGKSTERVMEINRMLGNMAAEAGYRDEEFEYTITVKRREDDAAERKHRYEIRGTFLGNPVERVIVAYNREQANYLAEKANIGVRKIKDLGTTLRKVTPL